MKTSVFRITAPHSPYLLGRCGISLGVSSDENEYLYILLLENGETAVVESEYTMHERVDDIDKWVENLCRFIIKRYGDTTEISETMAVAFAGMALGDQSVLEFLKNKVKWFDVNDAHSSIYVAMYALAKRFFELSCCAHHTRAEEDK